MTSFSITIETSPGTPNVETVEIEKVLIETPRLNEDTNIL
jgi:hypothetical protein